MAFPASLLGVGTLLLLLAASLDVWKRKIPNTLNAVLGLAGLWAQASVRGWGAAAWGVGGAILTIVVLWLPWWKGQLGGGDVKMAGAGAVWVGAALPIYWLLIAVAGGVVAVACYLLSARTARQ